MKIQSLWLCMLTLAVLCSAQQPNSRPVSQQASSAHAGSGVKEMSAETIFERFASRVLFLVCDESADKSLLASGVLVSPDGFVLTNAHVVEGCQNMTATQIHKKSRQPYVPVLKYYDERNDVAVLKIAGRGFDYFGVSASEARIGERVYAIGNPRGFEQSISEGIISGNREFDGSSWIQHSAPISPGSSGGALVSAHGELLGINSSFMVDSQNINFAVPAPTLAIALRRARAVSGDLHFPQLGDKEFSMGLLYYEGRGVPQDYAEAAKLMRQAADQGHAEAQATLGALYQSGRGVLQDYGQAAAWFRKSAEQGFPFGQLFLGVLLSEGHQGVPKDDTEAAMWFRRAAEQGNALAQVWLADAYHAGRGVPQDWSEAYFWYKVASSVGKVKGLLTEEDFSILLNLAASSLTPEELSRAQGRAQKWIAEHPSN